MAVGGIATGCTIMIASTVGPAILGSVVRIGTTVVDARVGTGVRLLGWLTEGHELLDLFVMRLLHALDLFKKLGDNR